MSEETPQTLDPGDAGDRDWLCELLDDPARAVAIADVGAEPAEAGTRCEYLALLGLLAESVEPAPVPADLEGRILAAAGVELAPPPVTRPAGRRWLLPLAATLAVAAVALSAWQAVRLGELRAVVTRQAEELALARDTADRLAGMEAESAEQAAALSLLTAAGAEFCALRPPAASPTPKAYGTLAMSADGSHWYLRVVGLEPREGSEYRIWFLRDGDPIDDARLPAAGSGGPVEMMKGESPKGFNAVVITLEPAGSDRPSGPRLLFGNQRMRIL